MKPFLPNIRLQRDPRLAAAALLALACGASLAQEPPAEAGAPATEATAVAAPTRADAFAEFRRLFEAKQYEQAIPLAKQVVELTDLGAKTGPEELQVALMNLATTQYHAGDYVGAEASYLRVIELIESSGRPASARLARANAGLAMTYHAGNRHDLAAERFEQAIALGRRTEGLFNEDQLPLLESQAESLAALDRMEEALRARRYALRVVERKYGAGSLRYAKELESLGRWLTRGGAYEPAWQSLRRAIEIIEAAEGEDSRLLIGPLGALADNARRRYLDPTQRPFASIDEERRSMFHDPAQLQSSISPSTFLAEGQRALERAVRIADTGPDPSPAQVADTHTQLGDWLQWRDRADGARPHYQQAWQAGTRVEHEGKPLNEVLFGQPVLVYHAWPESWDRYRDRPPGEVELRNVEIELTVTADGRPEDPRVVADAGDPKLAEQALRAAASARYRPRMENGQPVATTGVRLSQPFYVLLPPPATVQPPAQSPPSP